MKLPIPIIQQSGIKCLRCAFRTDGTQPVATQEKTFKEHVAVMHPDRNKNQPDLEVTVLDQYVS